MKETYVRGFKVSYEDSAKKGIDYLLYDLDQEEAKVFFEQAKQKKEARFEDDEERQFTLSYSPDGSYTLGRRN